MTPDDLSTFHPAVAGWFRSRFRCGPTVAQHWVWPITRLDPVAVSASILVAWWQKAGGVPTTANR